MPITENEALFGRGNDEIRALFPALADNSRVFFDNPGGTQMPKSVLDAFVEYGANSCANVGGAFETSRRTDRMLLEARAALADLLGADDPNGIVFGASMTALTFHIARSFGKTIAAGDEILVTALDHDANVTPWTDLAALGAVVKTVPIRVPEGTVDFDALKTSLSSGRVKLLAITGASNALGTVPDLKTAVALAKSAGARVFVDGVQATPHLPTDVSALGCDFWACSAYKFFGPHVGVLYGTRDALESLIPHKVRPAKDTIPHRWEQGTLNHEGIAATLAAVSYLESLGAGETRRARLVSALTRIRDYEQTLCARLLDGLATVPDLTVHGIVDSDRLSERIATISFTWPRLSPRETAEFLGARGFHVWSGNYYAVNVMDALGLSPSGAVRVGLAHYNTPREVDRLVATLAEIPKTSA